MSEITTRPRLQTGTSTKHGPLALAARSAGVKVLVLPVGSIVGLLITRLIITRYGEAAYGQYGLLSGIGNLLPFADFGLSAAIINAVASADDPSADRNVRLTLVSAFRLLSVSALVIATSAVVITMLGDWQALLGAGLMPGTGTLAAGLCLVLMGLNVPFGVGQRVLNGLGRNQVTIVINALNRPLVLGAMGVLILIGARVGGYVAVLVYAAGLSLSLLTTVIAARYISPSVGIALRDAMRFRSVHGAKVFDVAWPMLLQMVALPIAMQSDRIVLSHFSNLGGLNSYNFAMQLYAPISMVMSSAGITLWSVFARERAGIHNSGTSPQRMSMVFAAMGIVAVVGVGVLSPVLSAVATDGKIQIGPLLMISFSVLMVARGANQPLGMYLTDSRGLRFQAFMIVLMLPLNLGLSIALAGPLGASGPTLGSAAGVLLCQVIPNWIYAGRRRRRETGDLV